MPYSTISPHVRIGALVGVLLTVLTGAALFIMHGNSQPTTVAPPVVHHHPAPPKHLHVVRPTVDPLLPAPLRTALLRYPLVVVGFSVPNSPVGKLTVEETRAGAAAAHVAFVSVDLLDDSVAGPLTALLPAGQLLPNPGFAIYLRDGTFAYRSYGYLSSAGVTQAIKASVPPGSETSARPTVLLYTSNPKAVLAKFEREASHAAAFSDVSCRLYGGNQRTGWQHVSCAGTVTVAGVAHRFTSVITPQSCSRVTSVVTIDGVGSQIKTHAWGKTRIFTCKAAR